MKRTLGNASIQQLNDYYFILDLTMKAELPVVLPADSDYNKTGDSEGIPPIATPGGVNEVIPQDGGTV